MVIRNPNPWGAAIFGTLVYGALTAALLGLYLSDVFLTVAYVVVFSAGLGVVVYLGRLYHTFIHPEDTDRPIEAPEKVVEQLEAELTEE